MLKILNAFDVYVSLFALIALSALIRAKIVCECLIKANWKSGNWELEKRNADQLQL